MKKVQDTFVKSPVLTTRSSFCIKRFLVTNDVYVYYMRFTLYKNLILRLLYVYG